MKLFYIGGGRNRTVVITMPAEIRRMVGWKAGDVVFVSSVSVEDDTITLHRVLGDPAHDPTIPMPTGTALASDLPTGVWPEAPTRKLRPDYARGNDWQEASPLASEASDGDDKG